MGQRHARMVAERMSIRAYRGTVSTEWVEKERFLGKESILPLDAKAGPDEVEEHRDGSGEVSFLTDSSRLESRRTGAGVSWRHQQGWKTQKVHMHTN